MKLAELSLSEVSEKLQKKEVSSQELTQQLLDRIEQLDPKVNSFLQVTPERALADAKKADEQLASGGGGPLLGVPLALKDIFLTQGITTTCASKILQNYKPIYESTPSRKLAKAGSVLLGKLNMDEFAMGSSTENSAYQNTRNPWNTDYVPGGSSGGSAASVAADFCYGALGTDTGGSIRQPAACCGCVGVKPTYGRVSRYGVIAFASSLDQVGPFTKTVGDAALLLREIAGHDPADSTSVDLPVPDFVAATGEGCKGMTIGLPRQYFVEGMDPEVERAVREAVTVIENAGAKVVEIDLPHTDYALPVYYIVATAEASANLARYDGVRFGYRAKEAKDLIDMYRKSRSAGFGPEVKRRIMLGTFVLASGYYDAYYLKALKVRTLIKQDFDKAFAQCDAIVTPTAPTTAFKIGEKSDDPLEMYLSDVLTVTVNLAGLPSMSMPCGFSSAGLPIGLQIMAGNFKEEQMFKIAGAYEAATEWHLRKPALGE
jgi:aspartyl-tRNA(Asn)/glutamyl-tRNA(Gln) amidotransferase subunit A